VAWATDALDAVRRDTWNAARKVGRRVHARDLEGARYALWKNPEDLTDRQLNGAADQPHGRSIARDAA
jgi:transposase